MVVSSRSMLPSEARQILNVAEATPYEEVAQVRHFHPTTVFCLMAFSLI